MAYDNERIERALLALLQSELGAALDAVEALWASVDALTLPEPENWARGHKLTALDYPSSGFPFVEVLAFSRTPQGRADQWLRQEVEIETAIEFLVVAGSEEDASQLGHRYLEALLTVLQDNPRLSTSNGGYKQRDFEPGTTLTLPGRHAKYDLTRQGADMFSSADEDWLVGGSVEVTWLGY